MADRKRQGTNMYFWRKTHTEQNAFAKSSVCFCFPSPCLFIPHRPYSNKPILTDEEGDLNGKEKKAASKSVRTCGHRMKQWCHLYNRSPEFLSTFLMYSLFKSSHSITTFHCNFCSLFEERRERLSTGKRTYKQASWNVERGKVCVWIIRWKMQKERKEVDQSQRGGELKGMDRQGLNWVMWFRSSSVRFSFMGSGELFPLVTSASNLLLYYFTNLTSMFPA